MCLQVTVYKRLNIEMSVFLLKKFFTGTVVLRHYHLCTFRNDVGMKAFITALIGTQRSRNTTLTSSINRRLRRDMGPGTICSKQVG